MLSPANTQQSLSQRVDSLPEVQQRQVMSFAQLLKTGMAMQTEPISWASLVEQFYPNLNHNLKSVIAAVLQKSDPQELVEIQRNTIKEEAQAAFLDDYSKRLTPVQPAATPRVMQPPTPVKYTDDEINTIMNNVYRDTYGQEAGFGSPNKAFLDKLALSESSGDPNAEITIKDGRKFTGALQFGAARLADYRNSTKEKFTTTDFKQDPALQDKVAAWHFADIDRAIDKLGNSANEYDRNGLLAVAHLGGIGGMKNFVRSKGQYNPKDQLGTSLQDYYDKFSG
jgi:hypothetical protein